MKCEVMRFYRLLTAGAGCVEPVSMTVPRKVKGRRWVRSRSIRDTIFVKDSPFAKRLKSGCEF